ncbi:MAG: hypothetical protein IJ998_05985 [Alistipes sp.]|nr:hypothetical protein [Alistipes sp.]
MVDTLAIINTLRSNVKYLRTLEQLWIDPETLSIGNNAVTARCRVFEWDGQYTIKCYFRPKKNLATIYGSAYMPKELGVYRLCGKLEYIDIVLKPWVEGEPLDSYILDANSDFVALSQAFDTLACDILGKVYAHGDIKPENIIVKPDGTMELIDFDGAWLPSMGYAPSEELGTPAYRHPRRTQHHFAKFIDDFPIALISTALAALAHDSEGMRKYVQPDATLFDPVSVVEHCDKAIEYAIQLFEKMGDAAHYHVARGACRPYLSIYGLGEMLHYARTPLPNYVIKGAEPEQHNGLWGYIKDDEWIVPPLYDSCDDPHNGICRLYLGSTEIVIPTD